MFRALTGREPDPEDLKNAERTMADVQAKIAAIRAQRAASNSQKEEGA